MNEKITNQIAEMKKQTIGVEVEMNSITREKVAGIAQSSSEQDATKTQPEGTDTTLDQLGTNREENGNFKGM